MPRRVCVSAPANLLRGPTLSFTSGKGEGGRKGGAEWGRTCGPTMRSTISFTSHVEISVPSTVPHKHTPNTTQAQNTKHTHACRIDIQDGVSLKAYAPMNPTPQPQLPQPQSLTPTPRSPQACRLDIWNKGCRQRAAGCTNPKP